MSEPITIYGDWRDDVARSLASAKDHEPTMPNLVVAAVAAALSETRQVNAFDERQKP